LEKDRLEEKMKELEFTDNALKELVDKYEAMNSKLQTQKQEIIHQAKREAKEILRNANKLIERSVREIKENQAEKDKVKALREEVEKSKEDLDTSLKKHELKKKPKILSTKEKKQQGDIKVVEAKPEIGDEVRITGQETVGILDQVKGKNAVVSFDSLKFSVAYTKLEKVKVKRSAKKNSSNTQYSNIMKNIHERASNFKPNVDVRGMRAEEAVSFIREWIKILNSGAKYSQISKIGEKVKNLERQSGKEYLYLNQGVNAVVPIDLSEVSNLIDFNSRDIQVQNSELLLQKYIFKEVQILKIS